MKARENPFASGRLERVLAFDPELIGSDWAVIEARWQNLGCRVCVVGRHGSGKTTFLDAFARRIAARQPVVRLFFNDRHRRLDDRDRERLADLRGVCLVLDGDRHLPRRERAELDRAAIRADAVISARHRAGGLPVLLRLAPTAELARRLLERACPAAAEDFRSEIPHLMRQNRGNLRNLWLDCYDRLTGKSFRKQKLFEKLKQIR